MHRPTSTDHETLYLCLCSTRSISVDQEVRLKLQLNHIAICFRYLCRDASHAEHCSNRFGSLGVLGVLALAQCSATKGAEKSDEQHGAPQDGGLRACHCARNSKQPHDQQVQRYGLLDIAHAATLGLLATNCDRRISCISSLSMFEPRRGGFGCL